MNTTFSKIFLEQDRWTLFAYYNLAFIQGTVWSAAAQLAESSRLTLFVQNANSVVVVANLLIVYLLSRFNQLSTGLVIGFSSLSWLIGSFSVFNKYRFSEPLTYDTTIEKASWFQDFKEILSYCAPLVPNILLVFLHDFIERWMLQKWAGDREQAYFGLSQQFAAVSLIVTASVVKIFWREIAELYYKSDMAGVFLVYEKSVKLLYSLGTIITGSLQPISAEIVAVTLGNNYAQSALTFGIMTLYPIHQSMGQIGGALLMATANTKKFAIASTVGLFVNMVVAYILLAPQNAKIPGLGLGATGLSIKFIIGQILSVNIQSVIIARMFNWKYEWRYQIISLIAPISIGWLSKYGAYFVIGGNRGVKTVIVVTFVVYSVLISLFIILFPGFSGLTRGEIKKLGAVLQRGLKGLKEQFC
jgi:O-antigen/teichoic acid export membrane protein